MSIARRATELTNLVRYKPHTGFRITEKNGCTFLQHTQLITCTNDGVSLKEQRGRKFYLSEHMTDSEILQTALMAVLAFEEHEARELFKFGGKRIYGPHIDVGALMNACDQKDARAEPEEAA